MLGHIKVYILRIGVVVKSVPRLSDFLLLLKVQVKIPVTGKVWPRGFHEV